jgi:hypothetical protein
MDLGPGGRAGPVVHVLVERPAYLSAQRIAAAAECLTPTIVQVGSSS